MNENHALKQSLPYPYNQDLSAVLRRLDRRTPFTRCRLANDPVTAAYIAAGMRLIQRHLGPGAERILADTEDENSVSRPILSFLSQRAVVAEVAHNPDPFPRSGSISTLRCSWRSHSDFIADLLSFGLWSLHEPGFNESMISSDVEQLIDGPDFVGAAHRLCYYKLMAVFGQPTFRLELIAAAVAEGDDVIRGTLAEFHQGSLEPWKQIYAEMFFARGIQLRPGIELDDFAEMLAALVSGFGLRGVGAPESLTIDHEQQHSLFGTAALALLLGCVERADDDAQGITVEQAAKEMIYGLGGAVSSGECIT